MNATKEAFSGDLVNESTETAAASRMKERRGRERDKEQGERNKSSGRRQ